MTDWEALLRRHEAEICGDDLDGRAFVRSANAALYRAESAGSTMAFHLLAQAEDELRAAASLLAPADAAIAWKLADECREVGNCDLRTLPDVAARVWRFNEQLGRTPLALAAE